MLRKKIWITGDSLPTFANYLQGGTGTLTPSIVDDYLRLEFANPKYYLYVDMPSITDYVIQTGDYLEYDVYWETAGAIQIAMDFYTTDGEFRDSGAVDQNNLSVHVSTDMSAYCSGVWYHRKMPFTIFTGGSSIGKTLIAYMVACEMDTTNTVIGRLRNIAITDGNGFTTIKKLIGLQNTTFRTIKKTSGVEIERIKKISGVLNI